jgi:hypothetical protein
MSDHIESTGTLMLCRHCGYKTQIKLGTFAYVDSQMAAFIESHRSCASPRKQKTAYEKAFDDGADHTLTHLDSLSRAGLTLAEALDRIRYNPTDRSGKETDSD